RLEPAPVEHADHLAPYAGGVGERAEQVEERADAELAAWRGRVPQRRLQRRRVEEGEAHRAETRRERRGREREPDPERLEGVRATHPARHGAVAVLGDRDAGGRGDQAGGGRDIERAGAVA